MTVEKKISTYEIIQFDIYRQSIPIDCGNITLISNLRVLEDEIINDLMWLKESKEG